MTTLGSTGDIQPFLALGQELIKRGHQVRICSLPMYRSKVEALGLEFYPTAPDIVADDISEMMRQTYKTISIKKGMDLMLSHLVLRDCHQRFQDCLTGIDGFDVVVSHHIDFVGQEAAIKLGIPWVSTIFCPGALPTTHRAPSAVFRLTLGKTVNSMIWNQIDAYIRSVFRARVDAFLTAIDSPRRGLGLVPLSPHLNFVAASPAVSPIFNDLPAKTFATGAWFLDEDDTFTPSAELASFIAGGPPPVVVSFGSMTSGDGRKMGKVVTEALRRSGLRAILQRGWGDLEIGSDPAEPFLMVDYVPHSYLFRHSVCVVHHGGAGTTAAVCKAGKPSIVIPHAGDQLYWGRSLHEVGVAPKMILKPLLSANRLYRRLRDVSNNHRMIQTAKAVGDTLAKEGGVTIAARILEQTDFRRDLQNGREEPSRTVL